MIKLLFSAWISLIFCWASPAQAKPVKDDPLRLEAVREMVAVLRMDEHARSWIDRELPGGDSQRALMDHMRANVSSDEILLWYAELYEIYTSTEAARRISAAYRTPAGRKALEQALHNRPLSLADEREVQAFNVSDAAREYQRVVARAGPQEASLIPAWMGEYEIGLIEEGLQMAERSQALSSAAPDTGEPEPSAWTGVASVDRMVAIVVAKRRRERQASKRFKAALDNFQAEKIVSPPRLVSYKNIQQGRIALDRMVMHLERLKGELAASDAEVSAALDKNPIGTGHAFRDGALESQAQSRAVFAELFASHGAMYSAYRRILDFAQAQQSRLGIAGDALRVAGNANLTQYIQLQLQLQRAVERCRQPAPIAGPIAR